MPCGYVVDILTGRDHTILIKRLSLWHGVSGTALSWFSSYLTDRPQS